jgi:hypothetical protein
MNQTPHCCGSWSLAPAGREMWSSEESRAIRAITMPAKTWIQPWRSRQRQQMLRRRKKGRRRKGRRARGAAVAGSDAVKSDADSGEGWTCAKARGHQCIQHSMPVLPRWAWAPGLSTTSAACMACRSGTPHLVCKTTPGRIRATGQRRSLPQPPSAFRREEHRLPSAALRVLAS